MAAKDPLNDPAVPDNAVNGIHSGSNADYKGFNFDMGTPEHNITCNSCHAGGGPAQFGREQEPLDELLKSKIGADAFNSMKNNGNWTIHDNDLLEKTGIDGDLLAYNTYEIAAGYIGKPGVFNFARSGVNDVDCFLCHSDANSTSKISTTIGGKTHRPIMPANPRVMVFKGETNSGETIVISLGVPPKVGEQIGNKQVSRVDSAYYYSIPIEVLSKLYNNININNIKNNDGTQSRFFIYPNNANGATREVARVTYFEHKKSTQNLNGGECYVVGGGRYMKDDDNDVVYRAFAGFFFKYVSTASLMGVDTDRDGVPLVYVRFIKENGIWKPQVFYDFDEFTNNKEVNLPILMSKVNNSYTYTVPKLNEDGTVERNGNYPQLDRGNKDESWGYVCSYCHMAIVYPDDNSTNGYAWVTRKGTLGLSAEIVKRGDVFSYHIHIGNQNGASVISFGNIPIGYDVHFDSERGGLTCLSCHGEGTLSDEEKNYHPIHHNFLKGNDWGGHWDQFLDYNPSLKTCIDCHFEGSKTLASEAHSGYFTVNGESKASIHIDKLSCEVCHIPYKTHWAFRTFNDALGYSYNFDNRIWHFDPYTPLQRDQFSPGFGPFMPITGYGAPMPYPIAKTDDNGNDIIVPMYQVDFDPRQADMRKDNAQMMMWEIPSNSFPWKWVPAIINNGYRPDTPGKQNVKYRIANPLTLITWYDNSTGKVLYTREMAAALTGIEDSKHANKKIPAFIYNNDKMCVKTINNDLICDDNGDYLPEINTNAEYQAMKEALKKVLESEGVENPEPILYLWVAPFSIDHGVLPKEYALGSNNDYGGSNTNSYGCSQCHDAQNGRLPQANNPSSNSIERNSSGNIEYYGLGRKITLVPFELPEEALNEAKKVFFNAQNDNGKMTVHAGDLLVNALTNGIDTNRHLVPIYVEGSGVEGIAFAMPPTASESWLNKKWHMKFDGVPAEVETETLEEGEYPRRASVLRLGNEMNEILGTEHLAEDIMNAGSRSGVEKVFTPMIFSHYIEKVKFTLSNLGVSSINDLYINYAFIKKVRKSEVANVSYEVDTESFKPISLTAKEAINRGYASYSSAEKTFTLDLSSIRQNAPSSDAELALCIMKNITPSASSTVSSGGGGGGGCSISTATPATSGIINAILMILAAGMPLARRKAK